MKKYYKEFDDYVSNYDLNDINIKLKYNHSYRVMSLSKKYSKKIGFSKEDQELATIIGLLHDIGRFEQLKIYHTYNDKKSIDHALYGSKVLFEDGLIKKFWKKEEDYEIIKFAIENHNKFKLPKTNDERKLMHAKLIRDTDKVDILLVQGKLDELKLRTNEETISKEVIDLIKKHKPIDKKYIKNKNDDLALYFSFPFDINYYIVLKELKRNLKGYYKTIDECNKMEEIYKESIKYINERIDKYVRNKI